MACVTVASPQLLAQVQYQRPPHPVSLSKLVKEARIHRNDSEEYRTLVDRLTREALFVASKLCDQGRFREANQLLDNVASLNPGNHSVRTALRFVRGYLSQQTSRTSALLTKPMPPRPVRGVPGRSGMKFCFPIGTDRNGKTTVSACVPWTQQGYVVARAKGAQGYLCETVVIPQPQRENVAERSCCGSNCCCGDKCRCAAAPARSKPSGSCAKARRVYQVIASTQYGAPCCSIAQDGTIVIGKQRYPSVFMNSQKPRIYLVTVPLINPRASQSSNARLIRRDAFVVHQPAVYPDPFGVPVVHVEPFPGFQTTRTGVRINGNKVPVVAPVTYVEEQRPSRPVGVAKAARSGGPRSVEYYTVEQQENDNRVPAIYVVRPGSVR